MSAHDHTTPGYIVNKDDLVKRLRRVEEQVGGIAAMVEDDRCLHRRLAPR